MFTVRISPAQMGKLAAGLGQRANAVAQDSLAKAAKSAVKLARERTQDAGAVAFGKMFNGWQANVKTDHTALITNTQPYAVYVDRGRRAGSRMPPVEALIPWVRQVLQPTESRTRAVAFVVAKAIARRGIAARPIVSDAKFRDAVDDLLSKELDSRLEAEMKKQAGLLAGLVRRFFGGGF